MNVIFNLLMFESNVSIFSQFNSRRAKKMKRMQRDGIISTSFHSLWICVVVLLHIVNETMVEAVCAPLNKGDLGTARDACFSESDTGNCPNFAAASNGAGCNNGGVNGVIGDWDVSQVTSFENVFHLKEFFNADISKWDTSSVTTMLQGMFLFLLLFSHSHI
jgi:hypothetical protein